CFDEKGKRFWKLGTGCGTPLSMQFHDDRLYIVTSSGVLACIDATEEAIKDAQQGKVPKVKEVSAPRGKGTAALTNLATTKDAGKGVLCECVEEKGKLRVRVLSRGYHKDWNVQFPRAAREKGARYVVESVKESDRGGFYRAHGDIKRLV